MWTQDRRGVEHTRHAHIVHERLFAKRLLDPEISRRRRPDPVRALAILRRAFPAQPILFAEVGMPTWLSARELLVIVPRLARRLDGVDDPRVARATAKMGVESLGDRFAIVCTAMLQQASGTDHDAGNAESALNGA